MQTVRLALTLSAGFANVTAEHFGDHLEVTSVTDAAGRPMETTFDDLDRIERAAEGGRSLAGVRSYSVAETNAVDVRTGFVLAFLVKHAAGRVVEVRFADTGFLVSPHGEQFTETAEAFYIDREAAMLEDAADLRFARY